MNHKKIMWLLPIGVLLAACEGKNNNPTPTTNNNARTIYNLDANAGDTTGKTKYTFFSLRSGEVIPRADSASDDWDIAFHSTTIIVNSGTSGPGSAAAQVVVGLFDELTTAPETGYNQDGIQKAIPTGSGNGWYNYNSTTHILSPIPGRVIVVRTCDNTYAKLEILSYYKDMPVEPTQESLSRYYSFRYKNQPDGSKNLQ